MLKTFAFIMFLSIFISCRSQHNLKFNAYKKTFILSLPRGYKLKKYLGDEGRREYHAVYADSSIVFITDDNKSGSAFNRYKIQKYGNNVALNINLSDTLALQGQQPNGRYWKEKKVDQVVIGYMNIPNENIEIFDNVLFTLNNGRDIIDIHVTDKLK